MGALAINAGFKRDSFARELILMTAECLDDAIAKTGANSSSDYHPVPLDSP